MAGTDSKISGWLLEYVYKTAWDTFRKKQSIDEDGCRDVIQWLVSQQTIVQTTNPKHMMQLQILLQMSRLTDGENYETRYSDDNDWTVLEDMLNSFKGLANNLPVSYKPMMDKNRDLIIKQAVLVACRESDFEAAEDIFKRISNQIREKTIADSLKSVLASKSKDHKYVTSEENSYSTFVSYCVSMISEINKEFDVPFLTKIAEGQRRQEKKKNDVRRESGADLSKPKAKNEKRLALLKTVSKKMVTETEHRALAWRHTDEKEMRGAVETTRSRTVDSLLDEVSPPPTKKARDSPFKPPLKVPHRPAKTSTSKNEDVDKRTDLDLSPLRSPKGIHQFSYRKNISRPNRHLVNKSDNANSDGRDSDSDEEQTLGPRLEKRYGCTLSPVGKPSSILRPSSPTESMFSSRKTRWGFKETEEFYQAVQEFGVGKWADIREALGTFRTNVNLKDKWRTIQKTKEILELEKKFGPV
ncbi:uncharacterized protein LOC117338831 [Pecten maximus]|uniref:uncharacterized protein LOC117338831 n=1 Tax=Pecten maximus TaxID=6579 RepID=UPI0014586062|nr:uncharacterized protein LOC117338831 [Pecten maximus]